MRMPDKESILNFFINHVEKLCFIVIILCFFMIIWKAFSLPKLDIKPENLQSSVESAQKNLQSTQPNKELLPSFSFVEEAEVAIAPIQTRALSASTPYDRPLFQPRDKRTQPTVLTVRSLQGSSGNGAFGSTVPNFMENLSMGGMDSMSGRTGRMAKEKNGVRWVVITGLIPFADQEKVFVDTFKNAQVKTANDLPVYRGYLIERAEMDPAKPNEYKWEKLDIKEAIKANMRLSSGGSGEVVDTKYLLQTGTSFNMAMNLLTIANHRWGLDCAHLPEVPMVKTRFVGGMDIDDETMEEGMEETPESLQNPETLDPLADPTAENGMMGVQDPSLLEELPDYRLLRFFDTTVEAGKRYCYRFKLVINNPNYNLAPRFVQKEEMTKKRLLESDWSEPSEMVEAPRDSRVLCVGNRDKEDVYGPAGQIMVVQFEENSGAEIYKTFQDLLPGKWLNFKNVEIIDPSKMSSEMVMPDEFDLDGTQMSAAEKRERMKERRLAQQKREANKAKGPKADFLSNCMLMDMDGGDKIPGVAIPIPSRTLILNAEGKLVIHTEMTDKPEVYLRTKAPEKKQNISSESELDPTGKKPRKRTRKPTGADII